MSAAPDDDGVDRSRGNGGERGDTHEFVLPDLGEGLTEAELIAWKVGVGDEVHVDELIVEVESAKSVVELPCPFAGRVLALHAQPGDTVHAGQALLSVSAAGPIPSVGQEGGREETDREGGLEEGADQESDQQGAAEEGDREEAPRGDRGAARATRPGSRTANLIGYGTTERRPRPAKKRSFGSRTAALAPVPDLHAEPEPAGTPSTASASATSVATSASAAPAVTSADTSAEVSPVISPLVRKLAKDHGLTAKHLRGSGPGGVVTRADVLAAIDDRGTGPAELNRPLDATRGGDTGDRDVGEPATSGHDSGIRDTGSHDTADRDTRTPITGLRKVVAERLSRSRQEIPEATIWLDVDATELLAAKHALEERTGEKFSLLSLVARFVVAGLKKHPILNSSIDTHAGEIVTHGDINLGVAAQTPRGLMVPVVHGAGEMSLRQLRDALRAIVDKAATGRFSAEELTGGTFTLNNYGVFGVDGSAPIINLPEVAMLGLGRIKERPWVVDGELTVRQVMYLSFVFDHRACDGAEPSEFVGFVANCIENPISLLPEV